MKGSVTKCSQVTERPQPEPIDVDVDGDFNDLDAHNYISPQPDQPRQRKERKEQAMVSGFEHALPQASTIRRSERPHVLAKPAAGQGASRLVSGPLQFSSATASLKKTKYAGPRPRNDFVPQKDTVVQTGRTTRQASQIESAEHIDKKRRIQKEGDGYEPADYPASPVKVLNRPIKKFRGENNRRPMYRKSRIVSAQDDDIEDDMPTSSGFPRSQLPVLSQAHKSSAEQLADNDHLSSRGSSPDELGFGPDENYISVRHVPNGGPIKKSRKVQNQPTGANAQQGYELRWLFTEGQRREDPDLFLVVRSGGAIYEWWRGSENQGPYFRVKNLVNLCFHSRVPIVILQHSDHTAVRLTGAFEFKSPKEHQNFLQGILPNINHTPQDMTANRSPEDYRTDAYKALDRGSHRTTSRQVPQIMNGIQADLRVIKSDNPSSQVGSRTKLKDRLTGKDGEVQEYEPGTIDATLAKTRVRKSLFTTEALSRRSARINIQKNTDGPVPYLDKDSSSPFAPVVPDSDKFSKTHDLGPVWKHPLIYPKTGKHRATVDFYDLEKLDEGEFLNDNLINFHLRFLEDDLQRRQPDIARRVYWFNTYFYTTLVSGSRSGKGINYDAVKKWTRNIDVFNFDYIIVPIVENLHWYVAIICNATAISRGTPDFTKGLEQAGPNSSATNVERLENGVEESTQAGNVDKVDPAALPMTDSNRYHSMVAPDGFPNHRVANQADVEGSPPRDSIYASLDDPDEQPSQNHSNNSTSKLTDQDAKVDDVTAFINSLGEPARKHQKKVPVETDGSSEPENAIDKDDELQLLPEALDKTIKAQHTPKGSLRKKAKSTPPARIYDPDTPAIVTLDSLGIAHSNTIAKLKTYLAAEAEDKRGDMEIDIKEIKGLTGRGIPEQKNFVDCGLYLLGYIQKFVQGPREFATGLLQKSFHETTDWPLLDARKMRNELRNIIFEQHALQEEVYKDEKAAKKGKVSNRILTASAENQSNMVNLENATVALEEQTKFASAREDDTLHLPAASKAFDDTSDKEDHAPFAQSSAQQEPVPTPNDVEAMQSHSEDHGHRSTRQVGRRHSEMQSGDHQQSDDHLDRNEHWERTNGTPPTTQEISIEIPQSQRVEKTVMIQEVPETPESSPPPQVIAKRSRGQSASPHRPSTRGKEKEPRAESEYFAGGSRKRETSKKKRRRTEESTKAKPAVVIDLSD